MKKFFTQHINFAYAVIVMMTLTLGVGLVAASYSTPGNSTHPLIHKGGGEQAITQLKIGPCGVGGDMGCSLIGDFDVRGAANAVALFAETPNNLFYVLENMFTLGILYIGTGTNTGGATITASPEIAIWKNPTNGLSAVMQKVNVSGNVRATNLNNSGGLPEVCITKTGVVVLCPQETPINGSCGLAQGGTYQNPPTSGLCFSGTASNVTTNSTTYNWYCYGSNGGTTASCQANRQVTYTYAWNVGPWGSCSGGSGSCTGVPSQNQGAKVDWNGVPFNWEDGRVYRDNNGTPQLMTVCASSPNLPYDLTPTRNFDWNAAWNTGACITQTPPYTWPSVLYEPSTVNGRWHRINTQPGTGGDLTGPGNSNTPGYIHSINIDNTLYQTGIAYRARCDINNNGIIQNNEGFDGFCNINNVPPGSNFEAQWGDWVAKSPIEYCAGHRPGTTATDLTNPAQGGGGNGGINVQNPQYNQVGYACLDFPGSCGGLNQTQCTGTPGCTWQNQQGTQTRTVACINQQLGTVVNDSFCPPPKPATSQSCG